MLEITQETTKEQALLAQGKAKGDLSSAYGQTLPEEESFSGLFSMMLASGSLSETLSSESDFGSASSAEMFGLPVANSQQGSGPIMGSELLHFDVTNTRRPEVSDLVLADDSVLPSLQAHTQTAYLSLPADDSLLGEIGLPSVLDARFSGEPLLSAVDVAKQQASLTLEGARSSGLVKERQTVISEQVLMASDQHTMSVVGESIPALVSESPTDLFESDRGVMTESELPSIEASTAPAEWIDDNFLAEPASVESEFMNAFGSASKLDAIPESSVKAGVDASLEQAEPLSEINEIQLMGEAALVNNPTTDHAKGALNRSVPSQVNVTGQNPLAGQTHWGTANADSSGSMGGGQSSSQQGQNQQGQSTAQQNMIFTQTVQEQRQLSIAQQAAVKAGDEAILKADGKDALVGAEIASTERRGALPIGLQGITQPIKHPQWGQALGQRVVFMANSNLKQAQITLNPEKLGHIQVVLQLDKDNQMNVSLTAQNGTTREAMESALPKLREMLEQAGVNLGSMGVSDERQFSESHAEQHAHDQAHLDTPITEEASEEERLTTIKTTDNIVDYYA
ncbi:MAG: flagellar hook-length control protein FliK [Gammaproteobacteria bacterium]|nr:flagellar hook-length control protein FliK [Gammaproteobacteria bacterium]